MKFVEHKNLLSVVRLRMTATLINTPRTAMIEKQASFSRTACRADESPRSVARPAASAESQIGADNHFWPVY